MADDRIQFDLPNLPKGVVPALRELAAMKGLSVGVYVRTIVIEHVLGSAKNARQT